MLENSQLSAIARLFSPSVLRELSAKGRSPLFSRLAKEASLFSRMKREDSVAQVFDLAFSILKKRDYRHEYIYKSAIAHKVLLGTHSLKTAVLLNEFRVGRCKADTAILNGTSTVYEIKSERDSLSRLRQQIEAYQHVFARVNIITGENHLEGVLSISPSDVGVMLLTERYHIHTVREAKDAPNRTFPSAIFDSIQLGESKLILERLGIELPDVPNTKLHDHLRREFLKLSPEEAHSGMVAVLKETRTLEPMADLVASLPRSLQSVAFTTKIRKQDYDRVLKAIESSANTAINWS